MRLVTAIVLRHEFAHCSESNLSRIQEETWIPLEESFFFTSSNVIRWPVVISLREGSREDALAMQDSIFKTNPFYMRMVKECTVYTSTGVEQKRKDLSSGRKVMRGESTLPRTLTLIYSPPFVLSGVIRAHLGNQWKKTSIFKPVRKCEEFDQSQA